MPSSADGVSRLSSVVTMPPLCLGPELARVLQVQIRKMSETPLNVSGVRKRHPDPYQEERPTVLGGKWWCFTNGCSPCKKLLDLPGDNCSDHMSAFVLFSKYVALFLLRREKSVALEVLGGSQQGFLETRFYEVLYAHQSNLYGGSYRQDALTGGVLKWVPSFKRAWFSGGTPGQYGASLR